MTSADAHIMSRTSGPHDSCRDTRIQTKRSRKAPRSRTILFESEFPESISSNSALKWRKSAYRQDGVLWGSYLHAREEPQRMPRRDAASGQHRGAAGQPYVRPHCSGGNRYLWSRVYRMRIRHEHRLLKPSRKCHSLQNIRNAAQDPVIGNALDLAVDDGLQVSGRLGGSGHCCLDSLRTFCSFSQLDTRFWL